jgi:hypothetical protein
LLSQRFISRVDNNGEMDVMKQLDLVAVYFRPRGFFQASVNYYVGYGNFANILNFDNNAIWVGFAGSFNAYFNHFEGTPDIYEFQDSPGMQASGTAFQIEIINNSVGHRMAFDAIKTESRNLYATRRIQQYQN